MKQTIRLTLLSVLVTVALAACGGQNANVTPTATITSIPTYSFSEPTATAPAKTAAPTSEATVEATAAASESTSEATAETASVSLDPELVERGKGRYEALECGVCHGDNGAGTDKAAALTNYTKSQDEFMIFMRSGGSQGTSHQYSANRLSNSGAQNLYQFLMSLQTGS